MKGDLFFKDINNEVFMSTLIFFLFDFWDFLNEEMFIVQVLRVDVFQITVLRNK